MAPLHSSAAALLLVPGLIAGPVHAQTATAARPGAAQLQAPGFLLPEPMGLQAFSLLDHQGRGFTPDNLRNRWTLLMFGYTHCPDVCPATLMELRSTAALLKKERPGLKLAIVFVTLDPERDSPRQLKEYMGYWGDGFVGVGGSPAELSAFTRQFRVRYEKAGQPGGGYLIDHTSSVALINPQGELQALFSAPLRPASVARDVQWLAGATSPR